MATNAWINEFDYSAPEGQDYVEFFGEAGSDLSGWKITNYQENGSTTTTVGTLVLTDEHNGYGSFKFNMSLFPGSHAVAIVLSDADGNVVQVIGYGQGPVTIMSGPGMGMTTDNTDAGDTYDWTSSVQSTQLQGTGNKLSDFTWTNFIAPTADAVNTGQTMTSPNDAPVLDGTLQTVTDEGLSTVIDASSLYFTDPEDTAEDVTFTVSNQLNGQVFVNGVAATIFTGQDIQDNLVSFLHDGSETTTAGFEVAVEDGDEDGSTPVTSTFAISVNPVNDAAQFSGNFTGVVTEHLALQSDGTIGVTDVDGDTNFSFFQGLHGTFSFEMASGTWTYILNEDDAEVAALDSGDTLDDHIALTATDGTTTQIAITINGITDLNGTSGNDAGNFGALRGAAGIEFIHGLKGNDDVYGLGGGDYVYGDAGNDKLYGDSEENDEDDGADRLFGGAGADQLWGGGGADRFIFDDGDSGFKAKARDVIKDFVRKEGDMIDLSLIDAKPKTGADDAFKGYETEKAALAHVGSMFIEREGNHQLLLLNTDKDKGFEMAIEVDIKKTLFAEDFVL